MSQSPAAAPSDGEAGPDGYVRSWAAINKLMRRGHAWSGHEKNCAFLNLGDGTFADASYTTGFDLADDSRALATFDLDLDGALDFALTNRGTPRVRIFRRARDAAAARTVRLRLRGTSCNRDGIGARVEVFTDKDSIVRAVRAGEGYLAQSSAWLYVGLGTREVERVVVHWPGGDAEEFVGIRAGAAYVLEQSSGLARAFEPEPLPEQRDVPQERGPARAESPRRGRRIVLASPVPLPRLRFEAESTGAEGAGQIGSSFELFGVTPGGAGTGTGRAMLLNLWSPDCAPCLAELKEFALSRAELERTGIAVLALGVDGDGESRLRALAKLEWPYPSAALAADSIRILGAIHGALLDTESNMPLPTSFLVDAAGSVRVIYAGRVDPRRLVDDALLLGLEPEELVKHATAFDGIWHRRPLRGLDRVARRLASIGLVDAAREFDLVDLTVRTRSPAELLHEFGREYAGQRNLEAAIDAMRRAVEADPDFFPARFDLGQLLQARGESFDAIHHYREALRIDPNHSDARFNLVLAYLVTKQLQSAEKQRDELEAVDASAAAELDPLIDMLRSELAGESNHGGD